MGKCKTLSWGSYTHALSKDIHIAFLRTHNWAKKTIYDNDVKNHLTFI